MKAIKPYKKDFDFTYASGAFVTRELINARPELARAVFVRPDFTGAKELERLCAQCAIPFETDAKAFDRINQKENCYALCVFSKYRSQISARRPHIVLANPADMGNLGTIIRVLAGLGGYDLAIIAPSADIWHPKTVRASMGALFRMDFEHFDSAEHYARRFPAHERFLFMTDGEQNLRPGLCGAGSLYSLVFGNEARGLDEKLRALGTTVKIPQSGAVDSLNLSAAVAIGAYVFSMQFDFQ